MLIILLGMVALLIFAFIDDPKHPRTSENAKRLRACLIGIGSVVVGYGIAKGYLSLLAKAVMKPALNTFLSKYFPKWLSYLQQMTSKEGIVVVCVIVVILFSIFLIGSIWIQDFGNKLEWPGLTEASERIKWASIAGLFLLACIPIALFLLVTLLLIAWKITLWAWS